MTENEKKELKEIFSEATPWGRINLSSIFQALIIAGIIGLWTRLESLAQTDVSRNEKIEVIQRDVKELRERALRPVFSQQDFDKSMKPFTLQLEQIIQEQQSLKRKVSQQDDKIDKFLLKQQ